MNVMNARLGDRHVASLLAMTEFGPLVAMTEFGAPVALTEFVVARAYGVIARPAGPWQSQVT
jgi:hypothetical protein